MPGPKQWLRTSGFSFGRATLRQLKTVWMGGGRLALRRDEKDEDFSTAHLQLNGEVRIV